MVNKISAKEAIEKIRKLLFADAPPAPAPDPNAPPASTDYTLKDGTNIKVLGDLAEGTQVVAVTAEGQNPIPDGTYELSDGSSITCVGGLITELTAVAGDPDGSMEMKAKMADQEKQITDLAGAMKTIADAVNILQGGFKSQKEALTQTVDIVQKIAESGADEPAEKPKTAFSRKTNESERMAELAAALKKIKESK